MTDFPTVRRYVGSYNFMAPSEKQAAYDFRLPQGAPRESVHVTMEVDGAFDVGDSNVWDAAEAALEYCEKCLFNSSLGDAKAMVAYLHEHECQHRAAYWAYQVERLEKRLERARAEHQRWTAEAEADDD
jgi:hypothetical protein